MVLFFLFSHHGSVNNTFGMIGLEKLWEIKKKIAAIEFPDEKLWPSEVEKGGCQQGMATS